MGQAQHDVASEIKSLVLQLFRAENVGDRQTAEQILAADFIPITRAKGQVDRDRNDTLDHIGKPRPRFERKIDRTAVDVAVLTDDLAIANSVLPTVDWSAEQPVMASYRNMHVFLRRAERWECVAWQVTEVAGSGQG